MTDEGMADARAPGADARAITLRPPRHRVERRAIGWWMLQSLAVSGALLAGSVVAYALWTPARPWLVLLVGALAVLLLAGLLVEPLWRYRVHRWETTDQAVYARTGWLVREWRVAPLSRVQTWTPSRGPSSSSSGSRRCASRPPRPGGAIDIGGLDRETAARAAERLTRIAQATPGDAT